MKIKSDQSMVESYRWLIAPLEYRGTPFNSSLTCRVAASEYVEDADCPSSMANTPREAGSPALTAGVYRLERVKIRG